MGNKIKIIIAGGGTGGHIFPAVSIAHALQRLNENVEILFIGAKGKMEMEKIPQEGFRIIGLDIAGLNRSNMMKNISLPVKVIKSWLQANRILKKEKPSVCIGVGGYASFPVLRVAQSKKIPTVIQEQNSYAGKSNKMLGAKAKKICVAYDGMEKFFPKGSLVKTGNPVRRKLFDRNISKKDACAFFGLNPDKKVLFAFGGSLGAKSINESIAGGLKILEEKDIQLIWQTGKLFHPENVVANTKGRFYATEFINEMEVAYAAADVIIARAGALSIAELCIVGKPVVFVPFPFASEDHQTHNAQSLVDKKAAILVKDNEAKDKLLKCALDILDDETKSKELGKNIKRLAVENADEIIAKQVLELAV